MIQFFCACNYKLKILFECNACSFKSRCRASKTIKFPVKCFKTLALL